jgi:hypothetical protein
LSILIGKKYFKKSFGGIKPSEKSLFPDYRKWQKVWKYSIVHYTPWAEPLHTDAAHLSSHAELISFFLSVG